MITSTIGRIFLKAYNQKYQQSYDARTFFDEVYYPLFYNSNKYMQWVQNSPFVQMKNGQKVENLTPEERKEKLLALHGKIGAGAIDASIAIGYAASEEKEFATTSGQVTNMDFDISEEDVYMSWIGSSLGIGFQGGLSVLFSEPEILLALFDGWKVYRGLLDAEDELRANQICTWNGQWLAHRYSDSYVEHEPMANFSPMETKNGGMGIKTQVWTKVLLGLSRHFKSGQMIGYVYNLGQTNTTIGYLPFVLPEINRPYDFYRKFFGTSGKEAEALWGTEFGFLTICREGAVGIKAMAPKGVMKYVKDHVLPKVKAGDTKQKITYNTYLIWILAMLNNEELWDKSQEFAQNLHNYIASDEKKLSKQKTNQIEKVLGCTNKKSFIEALTDIVKESGDKDNIVSLAKEVNSMPTDNVPYFLTLIRFNYCAII